MEIEGLKWANWAIAQIRKHQQAIEEFEQKRDAFIEEYTERIAEATHNCELDCASSVNAIADLREKLREFALNNLKDGEKTIRLPEGKLSFYASPLEFYFDDGKKPTKDSAKLIAYLRRYNESFVETTYKANWAKFKKALQCDLETGEVINPDGEVIEGLHALKPADKFKITLAENKDKVEE